jgi:hypothetical protein
LASTSAAAFQAFAQQHRVVAGGDQLVGFVQDVVGQHRYGGGTVTGHVVHLAGGLLDQLGADFVAQGLVVDIGDVHPWQRLRRRASRSARRSFC